MLRTWLELARISNLPTVWSNVLAGWLLAGASLEWPKLGWLLLGTSLLYTGGMFLNDAADAKWDREHRSERPIATGRVSSVAVWAGSGIFIIAGFFIASWKGGADWRLVLALVTAIVLYDLYHKPWKGSVIIMGACRFLLYLVAMSAAGMSLQSDSDLTNIGLLKAFALGCYVVGLTLAARGESKAAAERERNEQRLIGLSLLVMPGIIAIAAMTVSPGWWLVVMFGLAALHWLFVFKVSRLMQEPPPSNIGRAVGLLLAGIPFVDALAIAPLSPMIAGIFVLSMPLLLLWQRKIAAT